MSNTIRSLRVKIFDNDHNPRDFYYVVGTVVTLGKDDNKLPIRKKISNIEEDDDKYNVFVESENEVSIWKSEPKNQYVTPEYEVD